MKNFKQFLENKKAANILAQEMDIILIPDMEGLEYNDGTFVLEYHNTTDKNKLSAICKDKIVYQSRGDAYDALSIAQKSKNLDSKKPTAFYECPVCKKWHLTSSAKEKTLFPQKGARIKNVKDFKDFKLNNSLNIKTNLLDKKTENVENSIYYHASLNKFDIFDITNDIGYHFGTKEQAIDRMKQQKIKHFFLYKVKLNIKNILRTIDKKTWFGINLLDILSVNKLINRKEMLEKLENLKKQYKYDDSGKIIPNWSDKALKEWNYELKQILYSSGYDSIIYQNKYEDKNSLDDSIIVFTKEQINILECIEINNILENKKSKENITSSELTNILKTIGKDPVFIKYANKHGRKNYIVEEFDEYYLTHGFCNPLAYYLKDNYDGISVYSAKNNDDGNHLFIKFNNKYYDGKNVNGVDSPEDLDFFINKKITVKLLEE